ncbi:hypothetical protein [Streptomyces platensis]|uniref:hypothetical protein n=1 Tax=Streptomyces platensis TaxID=58346 RepID=UPI001F3A0D52|nr:hypothetical protein [Streptomyces platensis]MCF3143245.1 hypothetical protein [Streptomyces platensis]
MKLTRVLAGVSGVVLMGVGVSSLRDVHDLTGVLAWLGGAVVLHDGVIAPLVLLVGVVLVRGGVRGGAHGGVRGPVRGALVVAGALTVVALPVLLRPGPRANSSVLPLDYWGNWLVAVGVVAAVTALVVAGRWFWRGRRGRRAEGAS